MSTPTTGDLFLVNRGGVNYQLDYDLMSTLQDTDLLLVNRAGTNYQIAASDINLGPDGVILPPVEVLTPVNGAGLNEGDPYTPISSAYVSTDSTPIYYRYFPELITTVSGGSWVNENNIFDGSSSNYAELTGDAGAVSQVVFTPHSGWSDAETTVYAYGEAGGVIEILDDTDTVLRTYTLPSTATSTAIGIVRDVQKVRFTTAGVNQSLYIARINGAPTDYVISGRVAFEFTDDTDLDKMVAPIIMTDENGDVKVPTTSTVDSTTTIPGEDKAWGYSFSGPGAPITINATYGVIPSGERMLWMKIDGSRSGVIASNNLNGRYLTTAGSGAQSGNSESIQLNDGSTDLAVSADFNNGGVTSYGVEIGVAPKVLDIVEYTGDSSSGIRVIPHNLGCKPGMIIIKCITDSGRDWVVWHKDLDPGHNLYLNGDSNQTNAAIFLSEATADAFYINAGQNVVNLNGQRYVAYVYAADTAGKVKCGIYDGTGGTQAISTGFEPGFLLIKGVGLTSHWIATTTQTETVNEFWRPNQATDIYADGDSPNLNSTDFTVNGSDGVWNDPGHKYVYLAVAADLTGPNSTQLNLLSGQDLEYFTDGTEITSNLAANGSRISFGSNTHTGTGTAISINPVTGGQTFFDTRYETANKWLIWTKCTSTTFGHAWLDSERNGSSFLASESNNPETSVVGSYYLGPNGSIGYTLGNGSRVNDNGSGYISWNFLSAPEFFDIQKYAGTGSVRTIQHDLGVEPGCMIIKNVSATDGWAVYHSELMEINVNSLLFLNLSSDRGASSAYFDGTAPTSSVFTVGTDTGVNSSNNDYIAYLFAKDTPYVKCGSYTGAGAGTTVTVGFEPRWVLIKSLANGNWIILDKEIGYLNVIEANTNGGTRSRSWSVHPTGFILSSADSDMTIAGQEYVYVAIADESEGHPPNFPSSSTVQGTPDVNAATMVVDAESFDVGDTASAPALEASITAVGGSEGNKLFVDASEGEWLPGLYAKGTEITLDAPSPDEVVFTSMNQGTTPFSGIDATLSSRTWTLESGPSGTGPWTVVDTYVDYDALASQDGATPWTSNKPGLSPNTFYRVKCQYDSTNAESVESVYHTFKTGAA